LADESGAAEINPAAAAPPPLPPFDQRKRNVDIAAQLAAARRELMNNAQAAKQQQQGPPPEPIYMTTELQQRYREIKAKEQKNTQRIMALTAMAGGRGGIAPLSLIEIRLLAIVDTLFPFSSKIGQTKRLEIDERMQDMLSQALDANENAIRMAIIEQGGKLSEADMNMLAESQGFTVPEAEKRRRQQQAAFDAEQARTQRGG
jgi:hypothetical protein